MSLCFTNRISFNHDLLWPLRLELRKLFHSTLCAIIYVNRCLMSDDDDDAAATSRRRRHFLGSIVIVICLARYTAVFLIFYKKNSSREDNTATSPLLQFISHILQSVRYGLSRQCNNVFLSSQGCFYERMEAWKYSVGRFFELLSVFTASVLLIDKMNRTYLRFFLFFYLCILWIDCVETLTTTMYYEH